METALPSTLNPLRHRTYRFLLLGAFATNISNSIFTMVVTWFILETTNRADVAALAQTAFSSPVFVFSLASGVLADHLSKRALQLVGQSVFVAVGVALSLSFFHASPNAATLLLLSFALGASGTLRAPAWQASVAKLVPPNDCAGAYSLNTAGFNLARIVGPGIAAWLVVAASPFVTALAATLLAFPLFLALLLSPEWEIDEPFGHEALGSLRAWRLSIAEALARRGIAPLLRGVANASFWTCSTIALLPAIVAARPDADAKLYAALLICYGSGSLLILPILGNARRVARSRTILAIGMSCSALSVGAVAWSPSDLSIACLSFLVSGSAYTAIFSTTTLLLQNAAADRANGVVFSLYQICFHGGVALGGALWGLACAMNGLTTTLAIAGAGCAVSASALMFGDRLRFETIGPYLGEPISHETTPEKDNMEPRA